MDHAAATPVEPAVLKAMLPYFSDEFYNPSATYLPAVKVRKALEDARAEIAHWLGARPAEVLFTAGGTEANNLAIRGIMEQFPKGNVVVSAIDHESVLGPARRYDCREVTVKTDGRLDLDDLAKKIDGRTALVSIGYANNEIGTVQPLREISRIVAGKRAGREPSAPLFFHTDACQAANYLDLHAARLGVDLMTLNGGKIYGPKQSGALYVKAGVELKPFIMGGGQESGLRSGTENVPAAIGFGEALKLAQSMRRAETARLHELQKRFMENLQETLPDAIVNGSLKYRLPNNIHLTIPGQDNERLLLRLEQKGILAAAGSACSASDEEPSHVLKALGINDAGARASLRFTMGRGTDETMVETTVRTLYELLSRQ